MEYITAGEYREKMEITELYQLSCGYIYPMCPRCGTTIDRDYMNYCDNCGQRLGWTKLKYAKITIIQ